MSHMEVEITHKQHWYKVSTDRGTWYVPDDVPTKSRDDILNAFGESENSGTLDEMLTYIEGTEIIEAITIMYGYGVRLSAPGYLDCTGWDIYTNKRDALKAATALKRGD